MASSIPRERNTSRLVCMTGQARRTTRRNDRPLRSGHTLLAYQFGVPNPGPVRQEGSSLRAGEAEPVQRQMMRTLAALAIAGTATLAGSRAGISETPGPAVTQFTLANGLEFLVIPDLRTPVVTHMIWYRV